MLPSRHGDPSGQGQRYDSNPRAGQPHHGLEPWPRVGRIPHPANPDNLGAAYAAPEAAGVAIDTRRAEGAVDVATCGFKRVALVVQGPGCLGYLGGTGDLGKRDTRVRWFGDFGRQYTGCGDNDGVCDFLGHGGRGRVYCGITRDGSGYGGCFDRGHGKQLAECDTDLGKRANAHPRGVYCIVLKGTKKSDEEEKKGAQCRIRDLRGQNVTKGTKRKGVDGGMRNVARKKTKV